MSDEKDPLGFMEKILIKKAEAQLEKDIMSSKAEFRGVANKLFGDGSWSIGEKAFDEMIKVRNERDEAWKKEYVQRSVRDQVGEITRQFKNLNYILEKY